MQALLFVIFFFSVVAFALMFAQVLLLLVLLIAIAAVFVWAMTQDDLSTLAGSLCIVLMVTMTLLAVYWPDVVNNSHCIIDRNGTMWLSIEHYATECHMLKDKHKQLFGPNSDLFMKRTTSGGAVPKWPHCFGKTWDPCKIHDYVESELSCKI